MSENLKLGALSITSSAAAVSVAASVAANTTGPLVRLIFGITGGADTAGVGILSEAGVDLCYAPFPIGRRSFKYAFPGAIVTAASNSVQLQVSTAGAASTYANFTYVYV
jgi:hypothetical protein